MVSVYKIPPKTKSCPDARPGVVIDHNCRVIADRVQVFDAQKPFETFDAEMNKGMDIRAVTDRVGVLYKELAGKRRIIICFITRIVPEFNTGW